VLSLRRPTDRWQYDMLEREQAVEFAVTRAVMELWGRRGVSTSHTVHKPVALAREDSCRALLFG
jgi:hypothetical protein